MSDEHVPHSRDRAANVERSSGTNICEDARVFATSFKIWEKGHQIQEPGILSLMRMSLCGISAGLLLLLLLERCCSDCAKLLLVAIAWILEITAITAQTEILTMFHSYRQVRY